MNMQITKEQLLKLVTDEIENEWSNGDEVNITTEDDLHDFCLFIDIGEDTIEEHDYIYHQMCGLLPQIIDEVVEFIDDAIDYHAVIEEQWRTYYSLIAIK